MITPIHIQVADLHRQNLLATAARAHLLVRASKAAPAPKARPIKLVVSYARYAVATIASVAFALTTNSPAPRRSF